MSFPFNLPIALTLFRIVLVPLIIVFVISSDRVRVLIAAGIFVAASLTDWLDGFMARRRNQVTRFGTLLDPVADKLLVAAALVALVQVDMVRAWVAMVIIGRELAVTGLRGVALSMGVVVPASSFGKLKTVSQYVGITILILERGVPPQYVPFHLLSVAALWVMLGLTVPLRRGLLLPVPPQGGAAGDHQGPGTLAVRVLGLVVVYLIGSIPVGFLISRMAGGVDIRGQGSGSIGATNVLRTMGPAPAIATLLGDVLKGYLAVRVAEVFGPQPGWGAAGAVLAIVGNCWPIFLRFKGGKGVATGLGAFLALAPKAIVPAFVAWLVLTVAFRYVSLASIVGCVVMALSVWLLGYPHVYVAAAACAAVLIVWRHHANVKRLLSGTESRLGQRASAA
jgi:glycerol-3-phosphate acyltransferase PlsY